MLIYLLVQEKGVKYFDSCIKIKQCFKSLQWKKGCRQFIINAF